MFKLQGSSLGITLALAGFSMLSLGDAMIKYLSPHYSTYSLVFYNSLFGLTLVLLCSPWLGGIKNTLKDKAIKLHLLRGALVFVQLSLIVYAFTQMSIAKAYSIAFMAPIFSTLLAIPLLKDRLTWQHSVGIAMGFIGVLIILRPGMMTLDTASLAVLLSAFLFALLNIISRYMRHGQHTLLSWAFYPHLVIIFTSLLLFRHELQWPETGHLFHLVFLGGISAFGAIGVARSFTYVPTATAASFHYVQMLWGVGLGYLLFGDLLEFWVLLGAAVVIVSGLWLIWTEKKTIA